MARNLISEYYCDALLTNGRASENLAHSDESSSTEVAYPFSETNII